MDSTLGTLRTLARALADSSRLDTLLWRLIAHTRSSLHRESGRIAAILDATRRADETVGATAAATDDVSTAIRDIDGIAERVDGLTRSTARQLDGVVAETDGAARAVQALRREAAQITEVIAQINELTHTTRVLAFNAAMEATRAGEAGRSFIIVADEVRSLAAETRAAAAAIRDSVARLEGSVQDVETRVGQVTQAARSCREEIGSLSELTGAMRRSNAETRRAMDTLCEASETYTGISEGLHRQVDELAEAMRSTIRMLDGSVEAARHIKCAS